MTFRGLEMLTSLDGHACYPTGLRTLCGLEVTAAPPLLGPRPVCATCVRVAALFDAIDGSQPPSWRPDIDGPLPIRSGVVPSGERAA